MKQMKMRTVRTAGLVGGLATGALLLAGTAAQAADVDDNAEKGAGDLVTAAPDALGALPVNPDSLTGVAGGVTDKVPGLSAVEAVPGLNMLVPSGPDAEAKTENPNKGGQDQAPQGGPLDGLPVGDLLGGLGGGLPVPLPF
ncbi:hypothetical protein [Glycomyces terrestris]|uniref:ATP-binding protein n=1 Tax=Glycomyces terrestris TaxID=2493553 RepID=A0A426UYD6_9ACTN|nr:hypothetical protein [Glycomyces terrestris]RRR99580.1 hypothetical protein EIW28_12855 [Glycomyces terrestris]